MRKGSPEAAKTAEGYAVEAVEYFANARGLLRSVPIHNGGYKSVKRVREACGTAYLAVLAAVRSFLLAQGVPRDKLPGEYTVYGQALARHGSRNGKVMDAFHRAYRMLHLDGYYNGFWEPEVGKLAFQTAKFLIERLTGRRVDGVDQDGRS